MKRVDKLMCAVGVGLVACIGMAQIFRRTVSKQIHASSVFKEAMERLRENRGAKYLLGQPIKDSMASFNGLGLRFTDHSAVKVIVCGSKSGGILFFTAKKDKDDKLILDTVQLQIGMDDSKRLVIKNSEISSPS